MLWIVSSDSKQKTIWKILEKETDNNISNSAQHNTPSANDFNIYFKNVSVSITKDLPDLLTQFLQIEIANCIFLTGEFPTNMKHSYRVVSLNISGSCQAAPNYRSIALLLVPSKIIEKLLAVEFIERRILELLLFIIFMNLQMNLSCHPT